MKKMQLDILVVFFAYGGNGGVATILPQIARWWAGVAATMKDDDRIGRVADIILSDTPITMTRNHAVQIAREGGFDVILMLDSDNVPDLYLQSDPDAEPFWQSSFDFLYARAKRDLPTVIAAPYCGPPPHPVTGGEENPYAFFWTDFESGAPDKFTKLEAMSREQATMMKGIQQAAAVPTGVCLFSIDAFDLIPLYEPGEVIDDVLQGTISRTQAIQRLHKHGYFYYEYPSKFCTSKASTEDVTATRDIGLAGLAKFKEPVVFCNWDAWAGHMKPKCVGRPQRLAPEGVAEELAKHAVGPSAVDRIEHVDFTRNSSLPKAPPQPGEDLDWDHAMRMVDRPFAGGTSQFAMQLESNGNGHATVANYAESEKTTHYPGVMMTEEHVEQLQMLVAHASQFMQRKLNVLEIGSWTGNSAVAMVATDACANVHCIDLFADRTTTPDGELQYDFGPGELYRRFLATTQNLPITHTKGDGVALGNAHQGSKFDVIHFDADHAYESTLALIHAWLPHVADDGLLIGHDYNHVKFPGVAQAVHEVFGKGPWLKDFGGAGGFWVVNVAAWKSRTQGGTVKPAAPKHYGGRRLKVGKRVVQQLGIETPPEDIDGLMRLVGSLKQTAQEPLRIAEIGSWVGTTAIAMAEAMGPDGGRVFCIDHWLGIPGDLTGEVAENIGPSHVYQKFVDNTGDLFGKQILVQHGSSIEVAQKLASTPQELHMVFIDGDHTEQAVRDDIHAWMLHLRPDGIMAGHDYMCEENSGVTYAVDEIFGDLVRRAGKTIWYVSMAEYRQKMGLEQPQELEEASA